MRLWDLAWRWLHHARGEGAPARDEALAAERRLIAAMQRLQLTRVVHSEPPNDPVLITLRAATGGRLFLTTSRLISTRDVSCDEHDDLSDLSDPDVAAAVNSLCRADVLGDQLSRIPAAHAALDHLAEGHA